MDIDGRDTTFWVEAAAQGAAAVDNGNADLLFRRLAFFEPVDGLPAGQTGDLVDDCRAGTGGNVDDLFTGNGVQL